MLRALRLLLSWRLWLSAAFVWCLVSVGRYGATYMQRAELRDVVLRYNHTSGERCVGLVSPELEHTANVTSVPFLERVFRSAGCATTRLLNSTDWTFSFGTTNHPIDRVRREAIMSATSSGLRPRTRLNIFYGLQPVCSKWTFCDTVADLRITPPCIVFSEKRTEKILVAASKSPSFNSSSPQDRDRVLKKHLRSWMGVNGARIGTSWVVKEPNTYGAMGVSFYNFTQLKHLSHDDEKLIDSGWTVQQFLDPQLLLPQQPHRHVLRVYLLIESIFPSLRAYVHNEGLVIFTSKPAGKTLNVSDPCTYVSNHRFQSDHCEGFDEGMPWDAEDPQNFPLPKSLKQLEADKRIGKHLWPLSKYARELGPTNWSLLWRRILALSSRLSLRTLTSMDPKFLSPQLRLNRAHGFIIFGLDILVSPSLQPYLLEVNCHPSMVVGSYTAAYVKSKLLQDMVKMTGQLLDAYTPSNVEAVEKRVRELGSTLCQSNVTGSTSGSDSQEDLSAFGCEALLRQCTRTSLQWRHRGGWFPVQPLPFYVRSPENQLSTFHTNAANSASNAQVVTDWQVGNGIYGALSGGVRIRDHLRCLRKTGWFEDLFVYEKLNQQHPIE